MAEAAKWVKQCPNPTPGPSEIEIRPLYDAANFGDPMTPRSLNRKTRSAKAVGCLAPDSACSSRAMGDLQPGCNLARQSRAAPLNRLRRRIRSTALAVLRL